MKHTPLLVPAALAVAAAAAVGFAASAAASAPATRPTSLTLHAAHVTTAPRHKDALTATLRSLGKPVAGEPVTLESRTAGSRAFGNPVDAGTTDSNGQITVPLVPGNSKGHKEQYRVVFAGDATHKGSRSAVITVTVATGTD
jgi:5-hydroxyisourate hydrolase-like protein (transthyretin family)